MTEELKANQSELKPSDVLALERTRLAHERTMMAWIRTATSLITFGFAVYKFFQFETRKAGSTIQEGLISPREFALAMISFAVISLLLAAIAHRGNMRVLRAQGVAVPYSVAAVLAALVTILGIAVLAAVWLRS